jgi:phosphopantothenoylcysteine decarboxylase/phosphopantothenate--cysteine ligase
MALIALGVTGGISAYKAVEVARCLQRRGHEVTVIMTASACRFVGPLTFEAITGRRVVADQFKPGMNAEIEHIALASRIDLLVVAPATANIIGKFAHGIADDFLSALYLATTASVLIAPAMNTNMLAHDAVKRNVAILRNRGVQFVEPGEGYLACGWIGKGRLAEPEAIAASAEVGLRSGGSLIGRYVLVTAGPTYEDVDPVRYLGNRSSGRMGFAVAAEAIARGAHVVLVVGPVTLEPPAGAEVVPVRSADEMHAAVTARAGQADVVVMAAAVADYTPVDGVQMEKVKKDKADLTLALRRTPDILAALGQDRSTSSVPVLVGFAAETSNLVARARAKLSSKRIDLVVANDVSQSGAGFSGDTNIATLVTVDGAEEVSLCSKQALAGIIFDRIEARLLDLSSTERKVSR